MDWFKKNAWVLIVTAAGIVSSYAVYGYKISQLEQQVNFNQQQIHVLQSSNTDQLITLAEIKKDLEYMKVEISKISRAVGQ